MNPEAEERFYQLALTQIENIGPRLARRLLEIFGTATGVFRAPPRQLARLRLIGDRRMEALTQGVNYSWAEKELRYIEEQGIQPVFINDPDYPQKLKMCPDAPILLYYKGNTNLNCSKIVAIVGTRSNTSYGKAVTEKLVDGLRAAEDVLVVSGLASGIDGIAHRQALKSGLPTLGVLAHGLDRLYPAVHRQLALDMLGNGGLLTEFPSGTAAEKQHFPLRNRIVAGIADVTVVVETGERGGSMITAKLASAYNRDLAAFPGRVTDHRSAGCNALIRMQAAHPISGTTDLFKLMNWHAEPKRTGCFETGSAAASPAEAKILELLKDKDPLHVEEIARLSGLSGAELARSLLELELEGLLHCLPGRRYCLRDL